MLQKESRSMNVSPCKPQRDCLNACVIQGCMVLEPLKRRAQRLRSACRVSFPSGLRNHRAELPHFCGLLEVARILSLMSETETPPRCRKRGCEEYQARIRAFLANHSNPSHVNWHGDGLVTLMLTLKRAFET